MKNSGLIGGSDSKLSAAMELDLAVVVIDRPAALHNLKRLTFSDPGVLFAYIEEVYP